MLPRLYSAGVAAALIVAGMTLSTKPSPRHSPIVRSVVFLGDMSYALYCTHLLSFSFVAWIVAKLAISPVGHAWAYFGAMLATGLVIAVGTYLMFEKPTTNFLKRLIERPRLPASSAIAIGSAVPQTLGKGPAPGCRRDSAKVRSIKSGRERLSLALGAGLNQPECGELLSTLLGR